MPITIELPDDVLAALRAHAKAQGRPAEQVAAEHLSAAYDYHSDADPAAVEAVRHGLDAAAQGDELPFEEYVTREQEKRRRACHLGPPGRMSVGPPDEDAPRAYPS